MTIIRWIFVIDDSDGAGGSCGWSAPSPCRGLVDPGRTGRVAPVDVGTLQQNRFVVTVATPRCGHGSRATRTGPFLRRRVVGKVLDMNGGVLGDCGVVPAAGRAGPAGGHDELPALQGPAAPVRARPDADRARPGRLHGEREAAAGAVR